MSSSSFSFSLLFLRLSETGLGFLGLEAFNGLVGDVEGERLEGDDIGMTCRGGDPPAAKSFLLGMNPRFGDDRA